MIIGAFILMIIIGIVGFGLGLSAGLEMDIDDIPFLFEKNKKLRRMRKEVYKLKKYKHLCKDYKIESDYEIKIKEIEGEIQKELYREMGIKEKEDI